MGCKKIIVYEAQRENIEIIKRNLSLNGVNGEVYNLAVADKDGEIELNYEVLGGTGFGLKGNNRYHVRCISITSVLSFHTIDIAKFDCEGCEYSLLSIPCEIIRNVLQYIIEYHKGFESLKNKFNKCGYYTEKIWRIDSKCGGFKAELKN